LQTNKIVTATMNFDNNTHATDDADGSVVSREGEQNERSLFTSSESEGSDAEEDEPVVEDIDLEIVGLLASTNGRSCSVHSECGKSVVVGDLLRLKECVVSISGVTENAIKLVKITDDGVEGCTVAYIPRMALKSPIIRRNINCFCRVKDIYCNSKSAFPIGTWVWRDAFF
jgi:hypothetical protein